MIIGNNEKIILAIIKKYPNITEYSLHILFLQITGKKLRLWRTINSLRNKKLLKSKKFMLQNKSIDLPNLEIDNNFLNEHLIIDKNLRLGKKEKLILYILSKIKRASFQFLIVCCNESKENLFPVLQRLYERKLIHGYNSPIKHLDAKGRKYNPKYYSITELGILVSNIKLTNFECNKKIQNMLKKTENHVAEIESAFHGMLNIN